EAYDRESDARIYIHYDTDSVGFNGIQINYGIPIYESDPDSFYWDTSGMPEGSVYVYGKINDFVNAMVYDYSDFPLTIHHPSGVSIPGIQPVEFSLQPNYPNPFNASTTITYTAPEKSRVELSVYDVEGRLVGNLLNGEISPGAHQTVWNANDAASGIYFARIVLQGLNSGETFTAAQKILLVR
ncbi:MAG: T9SS type A sorting domain-containing protein, partial [FCB group bacterium]|nr:T9SS type A sorting domain-containing protein [FCB group bacterium]